MTDPPTTPPALDAAEAAANWWAARLAPNFQDNGDRSEAGLFAGVLGGVLSDRHRPTSEQVETFRVALARSIREAQGRHPNTMCGLHTDYGPDPILAEAAQEAGISPSVFPWKTNTWAYFDHFVVAAGHAAPARLAWTAPTYQHPPCHRQNDKGVEYLPGKCGQARYHEGPCDALVPSPLCTECGRPEGDYNHDERHSGDWSHTFTPREESTS